MSDIGSHCKGAEDSQDFSKESFFALEISHSALESPEEFLGVLATFRECHYVIRDTDLYSKEVKVAVDQCGLDFRHLTLTTGTLAEMVSSQWLTDTLLFFKNYHRITRPQPVLTLLSEQARDLSRGFQAVAGYTRELTAHLGNAAEALQKDSAVFTKFYLEAEQEARRHTFACARDLVLAQRQASRIKGEKETWKRLVWIPIFGQLGYSRLIRKEGQNTMDVNATFEQIEKAKESWKERKGERELANYIATKAGHLIGLLENIEGFCEFMGQFWQHQCNKFLTLSANISNVSEYAGSGLDELKVQQIIPELEKRKEEFDEYHRRMVFVGNKFTFPTGSLKPTSYGPISLPRLKLVLFSN